MFEPFQGHSGAELIAPELLNQVAIALRWKEYLYHVGSSFTANSTYKQGSSQVDRTLKKGDKTVCFTPLDPTGDESEE